MLLLMVSSVLITVGVDHSSVGISSVSGVGEGGTHGSVHSEVGVDVDGVVGVGVVGGDVGGDGEGGTHGSAHKDNVDGGGVAGRGVIGGDVVVGDVVDGGVVVDGAGKAAAAGASGTCLLRVNRFLRSSRSYCIFASYVCVSGVVVVVGVGGVVTAVVDGEGVVGVVVVGVVGVVGGVVVGVLVLPWCSS